MRPDASSPDDDRTATVTFQLAGEAFELEAQVSVPMAPIRVGRMLPLARALADTVVAKTCQQVEAAGEKISCRKGCGACCVNLVAISEIEARRIAQLIAALPEPRRTEVRARFAEARSRFEAAGLLEALQHPDRWTAHDYSKLSGSYFEQGVACPFLEGGACSIYEERPITCREFLVTSPPEHCAELDSGGVRRVRLPLRVFSAVARWQTPPAEHLLERVVPLIVAPEWAEAHPDEPAPKAGLDLLKELLEHLRERHPSSP